MRPFNKIFVTSLPRCATVSICQALAQLGVPMSHLGKSYPPHPGEEPLGAHHDPQRFIELFEQLSAADYDLHCLRAARGLADYPACCLERLEQLAAHYPDSLFIHVARDADINAWLQSTERQLVGLDLLDAFQDDPLRRRFMQVMRGFRKETFGSEAFVAESYKRAYLRHQERIEKLSQRAHERWLIFRDAGHLKQSGMRRLAEFLGLTTRGVPFPHVEEHGREASATFYKALIEGTVRSQTGIVPTRLP